MAAPANPTPLDRSRPDLNVDPLSLVVEVPGAVALTRVRATQDSDTSTLRFTWHTDAPLKSITHIALDGSRETDIPFEMQDGAAVVPMTGMGAHGIYVLEFTDGVRERVGERALPLEGGINFRDIGGYKAVDGRTTRWGRVFRSGALSALTPDDLRFLENIGVKLVCDLRMPDEAAAAPDRVPHGAQALPVPISTSASHLQQLVTLIRFRNRMDKLLVRGYIHTMIDQNAGTFGTIFRRLADAANLPAILHCTAGKDRAGMASALLLLALGVPEDTVLADYSLSNRAYQSFREQAEAQARRLRRLGINVNSLHPMLLADPATLRAALDHVNAKYGGVQAYLRDQAGVNDVMLEQLKANLLE